MSCYLLLSWSTFLGRSLFLDLISEKWLGALSATSIDDRAIFTFGTYLIHQSISGALSLFFVFAHHFDWFRMYRIQESPEVDLRLLTASIFDHLKRSLVTEPPTLLLLFHGFRYFGTSVRAPLPPWSIILRDWILSFMWTGTTFYWSHRLLHHPRLYKHIHKRHHEFKKSMAINTEYAHPLEHLVGNVITTMGGPLLLGSHVLVFWAFLSFRLVETFDAHSGYAFPSLFNLLPFWTGSRMHDFHHSHNVGAYGTFTSFWDTVCGTDKAYRAATRTIPRGLAAVSTKERIQPNKQLSTY